MTKRIRTWQSALDALVRERLNQPFAWGKQDCALFAADCVWAVTGVDPAEDLRGSYSSAAGAAEVIAGGGGLGNIAAARLGEAIIVELAQVGDVVLISLEGRETLSVCMGSYLTAPGEFGLVDLPLYLSLSAWRCTRA